MKCHAQGSGGGVHVPSKAWSALSTIIVVSVSPWSTVKSPVVSLKSVVVKESELWGLGLRGSKSGSTLPPFQRFCHFLLPELPGGWAE